MASRPARSGKALGAVGGGEDDDALGGVKAVHLDEQLVERLLALVVASHAAAVALLAYGVYLVDEHDARRLLPGLLEQVANLGRAHADEHLDELTAGDGEERHVRLAGHCAGEQGLAGARRADKQRALGQLGAYLGVFLRVVQEVDDLLERLLGLVLTGHVGEGLARLRLGVDLRAGLAEAHAEHAVAVCHLLYHVAVEQRADAEDEHHGQYPRQEKAQQRGVLRGYFVGELYLRLGVEQAVHEVDVREDARLVDLFLAAAVRGYEDDLLVVGLVGDLLHLAVVHHVQEVVVSHLRHLPLEHGREKQGVQQYQHQ